MAEETNGNFTVYIYDTTGAPIGMRYLASGSTAWQTYIYAKNLQGDIVGVYNSSGTKLVSYTYDAWGNCTVSYVNGGGFTAAINCYFKKQVYISLRKILFSIVIRVKGANGLNKLTIAPLDNRKAMCYTYCKYRPKHQLLLKEGCSFEFFSVF